MKTFTKLGLSLALAGLMGLAANAAPIFGDISFGGAVQLRLSSGGAIAGVGTANFIDFSTTNVFVTADSGNFSGIVPGTAATFTDFAFAPYVAPGTLWSVGGATLTSPTLTQLTRDTSGLGVLTLKGLGTLNLGGFDATPGQWTITVSQGTGTFGFGSSAATIPDGGSTVILLGSAVLALFGVSRKFRFLA